MGILFIYFKNCLPLNTLMLKRWCQSTIEKDCLVNTDLIKNSLYLSTTTWKFPTRRDLNPKLRILFLSFCIIYLKHIFIYYRKNMDVILVHKQNTSSALIACASSHYCYNQLTAALPRNPKVHYKQHPVFIMTVT